MADQRYKIYEQLGAGGNGAVFRAYDSQLKRWVAIKRLLSAADAQDQAVMEELRREADTLASLRNANIVTIFDVGTDEDGVFMVMELLEGPDLADTIAAGPIAFDDFKQLAEQTLEALLAAHQLRILHRDIKPENIKVERLPGGRLQAKVIDFGLARSGLGARKQTEDQSGSVMGSIYYMAPEQLSRQPVDVRTDLYALGCVLYEALAARKPFDGKTVNEVIDKHLDHDVVPVGQLCPHLPQWMTYWVMRLMACKPEDRPSGAQQAIEEFRAWEKLPPSPQMMPWMPQGYGYGYPAQVPAYQTGTVPLYAHVAQGYPMPQTGAVPPHTTGYFPAVEHVPMPPQPVEHFVYAPPAQVPTGGVPARPGPAQPTPRRVVAGAANRKAPGAGGLDGKKKMLMMAGCGGLVLLGLLAFLFTGGSKKSTSDSGTASGGSSTSGFAEPKDLLPADEKLFPSSRSLPILDQMRVLHYLASAGNYTKEGKDASDDHGAVTYWYDCSPRGKNSPLKAGGGTDSAPRRVIWKSKNDEVKSDRRALHFSASGKPSTMYTIFGGRNAEDYPFGPTALGQRKGMTMAGVLEMDSGKTPGRVLALSVPGGAGSVLLRVNDKKELRAEFDNGGSRVATVVAGSDATRPLSFLALWDAEASTVSLRTRDGQGEVRTATASLPAPEKPLANFSIGRSNEKDGTTLVPEAEQFHGHLAEVLVYATPLKDDQAALLLRDLGEFYLQKPKLNPAKDRYPADKRIASNPSTWVAQASANQGEANKAFDGDLRAHWASKKAQETGMSFKIDLRDTYEVRGIVMDNCSATEDYPREFHVEASLDDRAWAAVGDGKGTSNATEYIFPRPQRLRYVKISLKSGGGGREWRISDFLVLKP